MIRGVDVTVTHPTVKTVDNAKQLDRFGNHVPGTPVTETVHDVLVSPGATSDLEASRPEGVRVAYTLHFPKSYTGTLEGATVTLPAPWTGVYRVIGDPREYIDANTPTPWHMPVEVEVAHG